MAWSGSTFTRTNGTYSGSTVWASDQGAGINIESVRHDTHDLDLANGINACLKKDGGNAATGNIPMGGYKLTGIATGTASDDSASVANTESLIIERGAGIAYNGSAGVVGRGSVGGTGDFDQVLHGATIGHHTYLTYLRVNALGTTAGISETITVVVYKNGTNTGKSVAVGPVTGNTMAGKTTGSVALGLAVTAGDLITLYVTPSGSSGTVNFTASVFGY